MHKPAQMLLEKGRQPKKVPDEQWLREYWENENKNNIDPGFYREWPGSTDDIDPGFERKWPSPDPKDRYRDYAESFKDPAVWNRSKSPLDYKDWLRMTRWRHEERGPHAMMYNQDNPEWWRTNRQRAK